LVIFYRFQEIAGAMETALYTPFAEATGLLFAICHQLHINLPYNICHEGLPKFGTTESLYFKCICVASLLQEFSNIDLLLKAINTVMIV